MEECVTVMVQNEQPAATQDAAIRSRIEECVTVEVQKGQSKAMRVGTKCLEGRSLLEAWWEVSLNKKPWRDGKNGGAVVCAWQQ